VGELAVNLERGSLGRLMPRTSFKKPSSLIIHLLLYLSRPDLGNTGQNEASAVSIEGGSHAGNGGAN
jgi:hypothetical protein